MAKHLEAQALERAKGQTAGGRFGGHSGLVIAVVAAVGAGLLVLWASPLAFLAAVTDGVLAGAILAAATLAGLWVVWGTGNGDLPVRWQIGLGAGFGIGALSLGMLGAGMYGILGRGTWLAILAGLAAAGLVALQRLSQRQRQDSVAWVDEGDAPAGAWRWVWLLVVPVVVLGVLAATVPPGMLWHEEGNGFDVLEYHLGVPKEYFVNGCITYLDHNMYSNFPMNAEMLYLLTMAVHGNPWQAAVTAQMIHLLLGGLAGYAAWLIGRDYSRRAGIIAGIAGAAFPWSVYLGALAYVENGMLFYGLLAAGLCSRAMREPGERGWGRALALGVMIGLACGYKYTAIPMIAVPLLGLWPVLNVARGRFSNAILPVVVAATMFAPWAVKNQRMTGDPVFPLGYPVFGSRVWDDADYAKFVQGHSMLPEERAVAVRLGILWERVIADRRFGWVPWIAAGLAGGVAIGRRRFHRAQTLTWLAILAGQMGLWLFTTHLFARFASVLWVPLVPLIAAVIGWMSGGNDNGEYHRRDAEDAENNNILKQTTTATAGSRVTGHGLRATAADGSRDAGRRTNGNNHKDTAPAEAGTTNKGKSTPANSAGVAPGARAGKLPVAPGNKDTGKAGAWTPNGGNLGMAMCVLGLVVYLVVGQGWIWREYRQRLYVQGQLLPVQGNTELFYQGKVPNFDQLEFINGDGERNAGLPRDAKLLMVNDVCGYYVCRRCDYYVTFSRNRFAEAVDAAGGDAGRVLAWLRRQGYTHVWASFVGMGQPGDPHIQALLQITPELFAQLERAGLKRLREARFGGEGPVYGVVYGVPR